MKMQVFGVIAVLFLVVGAVSVNAQSGGQGANYNIPFDFAVGNKILPTGEYLVTKGPGFVEFRGLDVSIFATTSSAEKRGGKDAYQLDFHRINDQYFLNSIWMGNDHEGRQLSPSKHEREMTAQVGKPVLRILTASAR